VAGGASAEQLLADYPYLEYADVTAALEYAAAVVRARGAARPNGMKLLPDANLSPVVVQPLADAGYEAASVADAELPHASDEAIFAYAARDAYVVVTADSDFPMMLAVRHAAAPSVVLLRRVTELRPRAHPALLIANLPRIADELNEGAIVAMSPTRLAVRDLPIG
jgi:predicted nuclease of predicted toxin-antitoxin system